MAITDLSDGDGLVYAVSNTYDVDGRISWHPQSVRGTGYANCYFLAGTDRAIMVDTGLTAHEEHVLADLDDLMSRGSFELSLLPLRQGEFDSMCNMVPIMVRYPVARVYGLFDDGHLWADFRDDVAIPTDGPLAQNFDTARQGTRIAREDRLALGDREIEAFFPPMRLLNTYWLYDPASRTLFTSDVFTDVLPQGPNAPLVVAEASDDVATPESVRSQLLETRYWWLAGAELDSIRAELADIFDRYEVETIAPSYGCVLKGPAIVQRHYELLDSALREAAEMEPLYSFEPDLLTTDGRSRGVSRA